MNSNHEVIGNEVSDSFKVGSNLSSTGVLRLSAVALGLIVAGFSMQATAAACTGDKSVTCGTDAIASPNHGVAIGKNAHALGGQSVAIGSGSGAGDSNTRAIGQQSIAIGSNVQAKGHSSIAIGGDDLNEASKANIDGSTASTSLNGGTVNAEFRSYAKRDLVDTSSPNPNDVYKEHTKAVGDASIAMGVKSSSEGALSTAMGTHASSSGTSSSAFGVASSATKDGSVALGAGSVTDSDATSEKTMTVGGVQHQIAGNVLDDDNNLKTGAQVSVGSIGSERQIKNVAGGQVSATSTDAVNGSQLFATNSAVNRNTDRMNSLGYRVDDIKDDANAGISSAMAIASLPQPYRQVNG
ncbi:hypothetical protein [Psychrobacter frigidicola]|uniref:hypothetical protein n=1 Tax=Psychrobacter frigidicola TaxID=45611 RepID=UPI001919CF3D|nr:hypothetical protein [Psychrobacter frigidicola]